MPQRRVVKTDGLRPLYLDLGGAAQRRQVTRILAVWRYLELNSALADDDHISVEECVIEVHSAVHKDVVDAAHKLAILDGAVDEPEIHSHHLDEGMSPRHTPVIENNVILFCASDRPSLPGT